MAVFRPDQLQNVQPQVPEIGRIFKGDPKRPGKKPGTMIFGQDLDYFRFEPAERTKALPFGSGTLYDHLKNRWEAIKEETGGWRSLQIRFPFSRFEDIYHHGKNRKWAEIGGRQTCVRECNGATVNKMLVEIGGGKKVVQRGTWACSMQDGDRECPEGCKAEAMLKFMIPALGYPGMIIFTTRSGHDITEIKKNLLPYYGLDYASMPFRLFRALSPCDHHQEDGTVRRQDKWLCYLEIDAEFGMLQMQGRERQYRAQLSGQPIQALPAAPALALPPSASNLDQQWFEFMGEIQACIGGRSHRPLMQVIESALNIFPESWHDKIYAEHDRAASAIGSISMPVSVIEAPDTARENLERLSNIRLLTGYSKVQAKAIAESINLVIADCTNWTAQQIEAFRDAVFVDWAKKQGAKFGDGNEDAHWAEAIRLLKNGKAWNDEDFWQEWQSRVRFMIKADAPEAQPVEATLV
jgi:hypothetical protein